MPTPTTTATDLLEARLEALLRSRVRGTLGGLTFKLAPTAAGIPDRLVLLPGGRFYLVELKTNLGRLSPVQKAWHEVAARLGTPVVVLPGVEAIEQWVRERARDYDDGDDRPRTPQPQSRDLSAALAP